jgi:hypothetical protein
MRENEFISYGVQVSRNSTKTYEALRNRYRSSERWPSNSRGVKSRGPFVTHDGGWDELDIRTSKFWIKFKLRASNYPMAS